MDDTIVAVRFTELGEARQALGELKQLDSDGRLRVREATLIQRSGQGRIGVPEEAQDDEGYFMPPGGIVSILVDALDDASGFLFGRSSKGFRGHAGRAAHEGERELALEDINTNLEPGVTLVLAEIADPDPDVLDSALDGLGGTVTRRPAHDVYAEIRAAEEAANAADEEARRVLAEQRGEERKEQWERFKEGAKSKLP
jgi:hypothetical protein